MCFIVVADQTYETTEMSTREVVHPVYTALDNAVYTEIRI